MHLIDGQKLANEIRTEVAARVSKLPRKPCLAVLLVGEDKASHLYVSLKQKAAEEAGVHMEVALRSSETDPLELLDIIQNWNKREDIDAILVQLPLPQNFDEQPIIDTIDPNKDVDGFHPINTAALLAGEPSIISPVHEGVLRLISQTSTTLSGKTGVIIANSTIFADPLARLLKTAGLFVHVMKPDELEAQTLRRADVIVIAIGRANFLHAGITKKDAVIIDVGTNQTENKKVVGDVDIATYEPYETWISPVPGGVGPMTIALLLLNVVRLAEKHLNN